uniref:Recombinase-like n=1 Tax=Oryzias latipes TaxID=8090 RepID=A0A286P9S5_ORYLA|nr:recombinase-like [Oryzias latipes]
MGIVNKSTTSAVEAWAPLIEMVAKVHFELQAPQVSVAMGVPTFPSVLADAVLREEPAQFSLVIGGNVQTVRFLLRHAAVSVAARFAHFVGKGRRGGSVMVDEARGCPAL